MEWSKPYYGVSHCGKITDRRWATVEDYETFCVLLRWYRGCRFSPDIDHFDNADEARAAGEAWIQEVAHAR